MPTTIADDRKALDYLASGKVPNELRPKVMEKLGVNDDDVKAWGLVANRNDDTGKEVRNKIYKKVAESKPVEKPGVFSGISAVRFLAKNFIDQDIETQKKFFSKFGYDAKADDIGNLVVIDPKTNRRTIVDPVGVDMWDISDILTDTLEGIGVGAATIAGAKAGGSLGAAAGSPAGPLGALGGGVIGAGVGGLLGAGAAGAVGETARQGIALLADSRENFEPERAIEAGKYAALFAPLDLLGLGASKLGQRRRERSGAAIAEKEVAEKLKEAAQVLGVELTPGMIKKDELVQALESSLNKSVGRIGGKKLREQIANNKKQIENVVIDLIAPEDNVTLFQAGGAFGSSFKESVSNKLAAAITTYEKYDEVFKNVKLNDALTPAKKGLNKIAEKTGEKKYSWLEEQMAPDIEKLYQRVQDDPTGIAIADQIADRIANAETINSIKVLRQNIRDNARRNKDEPIWQFVNAEINPALNKKRDEAIRILAKSDPNLGDVAAQELATADKIYATTAKEIENVIGNKKLKPGLRSAVNNWVDTTNEIKRVKKVLDLNDPKKLQKVAEDFPEAFELLRQGYKNDFFRKMERYVTRENVNVTAVAKELDKLQPETLQIIYGMEGKKVKDALLLYLKNLPPNINPSDTGKFLKFAKLFNVWDAPFEQINSVLQERRLNNLIQKQDDLSLLEYLGNAISKTAKVSRFSLYPFIQSKKENNGRGLVPRQSNYTGILPNR